MSKKPTFIRIILISSSLTIFFLIQWSNCSTFDLNVEETLDFKELIPTVSIKVDVGSFPYSKVLNFLGSVSTIKGVTISIFIFLLSLWMIKSGPSSSPVIDIPSILEKIEEIINSERLRLRLSIVVMFEMNFLSNSVISILL